MNKKLLFCSMAAFLCVGNSFGAECTASSEWSISRNNWNTSSNEYLFATEKDWMGAKSMANVYECDNSHCQDGTYVCLNAGHTFQSRNETVRKCYKCVAPMVGNDRWELITDTTGLSQCSRMDKRGYWSFLGHHGLVMGRIAGNVVSNPADDEFLYPTSADFNNVWHAWTNKAEVFECDSNACQHGTTKTLNSGHYFLGRKITSKRIYKCVDGDMWVDITDDVAPATKAPEPAAPAEPAAPKKAKTCEELYPNASEARLTCCRAGKATIWDAATSTCSCVDKTKKLVGTRCVEQQEETDCTYTFTKAVRCANGNTIAVNTVWPVSKQNDLNGMSCNKFKSLMDSDANKFMEFVNKYCPEPEAKPVQTDFTAEDAARDKLEAFFKSVDGDRSVWKNADGSFNTVRLASDLTAGVVLGTVGGVVSGVLIKKSQVEKGFDALNCTVGGQKVADWGDEFRVKFRM